MAATSGNNGKRGRAESKYPPVEWVNVNLSAEDKTALEDLYGNHQAILIWFSDVVQMGLKVSTRYDDKNNCSVTSIVDSAGGKNRILTGRGAEPTASLLSCLYRFFVILEGDFGNAAQEGTSDLFD